MERNLSREEVLSVIKKCGDTERDVLNILLELQYISPQGYISNQTAALVGEELGMTETKVYELVSFYSMLKAKPQAKHVIKVCNSSPCHFSKAEVVKNILEEELNVKMGENTEDNMFAFHYIPCFGACDIGPAIKVKDVVYGNLDREKIKEVINDLKNGK